MLCPNCGHKFTQTRRSDKRLNDDIARANDAIAICERAKLSPFFADIVPAIDAEAIRLRGAIAEPFRLWNIYRRKDKGQPYAERPVAQAA
jgi:hypothetical protein